MVLTALSWDLYVYCIIYVLFALLSSEFQNSKQKIFVNGAPIQIFLLLEVYGTYDVNYDWLLWFFRWVHLWSGQFPDRGYHVYSLTFMKTGHSFNIFAVYLDFLYLSSYCPITLLCMNLKIEESVPPQQIFNSPFVLFKILMKVFHKVSRKSELSYGSFKILKSNCNDCCLLRGLLPLPLSVALALALALPPYIFFIIYLIETKSNF